MAPFMPIWFRGFYIHNSFVAFLEHPCSEYGAIYTRCHQFFNISFHGLIPSFLHGFFFVTHWQSWRSTLSSRLRGVLRTPDLIPLEYLGDLDVVLTRYQRVSHHVLILTPVMFCSQPICRGSFNPGMEHSSHCSVSSLTTSE